MDRRASRKGYLAAAALTVAAGLSSLRFEGPVADLAGDALWTVMVYLVGRVAWPDWSPWRMAAVSFAVSCAVECQQLLHAPWLDAIRSTLAGRLLLGTYFAWEDFGAYLLGAAGAATLERFVRSRS